MSVLEVELIDRLNKEDKEKVSYFVRLLMNKKRYSKLKAEIDSRRREIKKGKTLKHEDIWKKVNV
ncbi:hypothetical protein BMS3Abin03_02954 [bacterium BMS3Abin03]|nr:hypothetical protein BMS3Abin03_02954 [bacterium BMS3Abin03]